MRAGFLGVAIAILAACSGATGEDPSGGGGGGGSIAGDLAKDYCEPLAAMLCDRADGCGCGFVAPGGELDPAECAADYAARCLAAFAPLADAVGRGDAVLDGAAARACVALVAESTTGCERPRGVVTQALCEPWFTATARLGEPCALPFCAGGAGICAGGTCVARGGAGAACAGPTCASGLVCDRTEHCAPPQVAGGACALDFECAPALRCIEGSCVAPGGAGATCTEELACEQGLTCEAERCADAASTPCDPQSCGALEICGGARACVPRGGEGAACTADEACTAGHVCEAGRCEALPGRDEPCARATSCAPGLACDGDGGSCVTAPGDGEPCLFGPDGPFACAAGLGCVDGTCGALPGDGEPCTGDLRCGSGMGCAFRATGSVCIPLRGEGASCEEGRTCEAGLSCDAGVCRPVPQPCPGGCADGSYCGFGETRCVPDLCAEVVQ